MNVSESPHNASQPLAGDNVVAFRRPFYADRRGRVMESYNARDIAAMLGFEPNFVQDIYSTSRRGVLRGMHYQIDAPQGKLISVLAGSVLDIAVDLRKTSENFLSVFSIILEADGQHNSIWIPEGFAHGYLVLSEDASVHYKVTRFRNPALERRIRWDDESLGIQWPINTPILSDADAVAPSLSAALDELDSVDHRK